IDKLPDEPGGSSAIDAGPGTRQPRFAAELSGIELVPGPRAFLWSESFCGTRQDSLSVAHRRAVNEIDFSILPESPLELLQLESQIRVLAFAVGSHRFRASGGQVFVFLGPRIIEQSDDVALGHPVNFGDANQGRLPMGILDLTAEPLQPLEMNR